MDTRESIFHFDRHWAVLDLDVVMTGGERDGLQCVIGGLDLIGILCAARKWTGAPALL